MALRAVPDHPKFADLKARLQAGRGVTLGYLEAIWHFCGRFTPQGNIGKYTDSQIESWVEWEGEPGALVQALCDSHWIDRDREHRLLVHDWHEHADGATKVALKRKGLGFCRPTVATPSERKSILSSLPEPVPEPVPEPEPEPTAARVAPGPDLFECYFGMFEASGKPLNETDRRKAAMAFVSLEPASQQAAHDHAAKSFREGTWPSPELTPFPANHIANRPWTRVAKPRTMPDSPRKPGGGNSLRERGLEHLRITEELVKKAEEERRKGTAANASQ